MPLIKKFQVFLPLTLAESVARHCTLETEPGSSPYFGISHQGISFIASHTGSLLAEVMGACLKNDIWPQRFKKNRGILTGQEQAQLLASHAVILGCGGLGGHVASLLARGGIGALTLCDDDSFEESNLNRQLFCTETTLGQNKAKVTARGLAEIASHVTLNAVSQQATPKNLPALLQGAHIAIDCLDNLSSRKYLEDAAHEAKIPFIHAALAGEEGFLAICQPGDNVMLQLYGESVLLEKQGAEVLCGSPTVTPAALAAIQASLVFRTLLGKKSSGNAWHIDLASPALETLYL